MTNFLSRLWRLVSLFCWAYLGLFLTVATIPLMMWGVAFEYSRSKRREVFDEDF